MIAVYTRPATALGSSGAETFVRWPAPEGLRGGCRRLTYRPLVHPPHAPPGPETATPALPGPPGALAVRGVIVHPDGIETRELLPLGWPRVRRFHWSQIDRLLLPAAQDKSPREGTEKKSSIRVDLWDGSRAWLPPVGNWLDLAVMLEKVALARAIPFEGGTGLVELDAQSEEG